MGKRVKPLVQGNQAPAGGWLERGDHPLLNDLILETLFGFMRRCDLKVCRVVSKKWTLHTIPHMRATFKVTIHGNQSSTKRKTDQDIRRIDDFVKLFSSNELGIPFSKFKLESFRTTEGVGRRFLQLCGETATEIDLDGLQSAFIIEDVSELLRSCPNLKVLALRWGLISRSRKIVKLFPDSMPTFSSLKKIDFRLDRYDRLKFCPTFMYELMAAAPNITNISVSDNFTSELFEGDDEAEDNDINGSRNVKVVLNCIEQLGLESSIQSLRLSCTGIKDIEQLKRMAKNGMKLKSLKIVPYLFDDERDTVNIQTQMATCFKDSLEYLKVCHQCVDNILMEFPIMPKLKSLTQQIKLNSDIRAVNLNENFPALESLNIDFGEDDDESQDDWDDFFSEFDSCPTIKSLIIDDDYMKINTLHNFVLIFPNLTRLDLNVKKDDFDMVRQVLTQMTRLESLTISCSFEQKSENLHFDSLFTGIPTRALKSIRNVVDGLGQMSVEERRETILKLRNDHSRLQSIRNLTKVKHLELKVVGEFHLTDLTAYLAFYTMNHLRHLEIAQCEFTKTCCKILTKETGLETWSFRNNRFVLPGRK